jgi:hypothetical protein
MRPENCVQRPVGQAKTSGCADIEVAEYLVEYLWGKRGECCALARNICGVLIGSTEQGNRDTNIEVSILLQIGVVDRLCFEQSHHAAIYLGLQKGNLGRDLWLVQQD